MDRGTRLRTLALAIALINQLLVSFGFEPFPYDGQQIYEGLSVVATVVTALVAWFKNNFITEKGRKQKEVLEDVGLN